ncbi:hypothetical protein [Pelagicoccus mobilis]|uniref:Porin n=1 Tax=Pelagicoccus mobilis TaxID=415221 RepID=A0A934S5S0_9BACT|nr:hypothetical protein [Pelagicoccus mobilis]MBK1880272.1 hypothetical protein [Pelagicoccus mobilis]
MKLQTLLSIAACGAVSTGAFAGGDISFNGFLSHGYLKSTHYNYLADTEEGDLDFVEAGVKATWSPMDRTSITGQLFTFEIGPYGNYDLQVDYLFADYNFNQAFGLRAGRVKKPNGLFNDIQDIDIARTSVLLPVGIYDPRYRDFSASLDGVNVYGSVNSLDYSLYYGKPGLSEDGGLGGFISTILSRRFDNISIDNTEADNVRGGQIWWNTPVSGLRTGVAYSYFSNIDLDYSANFPAYIPVVGGAPLTVESDVENQAWTVSAEYFVGDWTFIAEYLNTNNTTATTQQAGNAPATFSQSSGNSDAWYIGGARRFLDKWEAGLMWVSFHSDSKDRDGSSRPIPHTGYHKDLQFSLRYDVKSWWTLKAEAHLMEGTARLFNQFGQNPVLDNKNWNLFALKSTYTF